MRTAVQRLPYTYAAGGAKLTGWAILVQNLLIHRRGKMRMQTHNIFHYQAHLHLVLQRLVRTTLCQRDNQGVIVTT